ncbi:hypothetical protein MXB_408 [Myxobolus squamalis]|nr:hypothetical protein MXB_408 [Myxobolus squamalis]
MLLPLILSLILLHRLSIYFHSLNENQQLVSTHTYNIVPVNNLRPKHVEKTNVDIFSKEYIFLIPCYISHFDLIEQVQKENYVQKANKIVQIFGKTINYRAFFYFPYNSHEDLEYSKQFSNNTFNANIFFIQTNHLLLRINFNGIEKIVDNQTFNSNIYLSKILDSLFNYSSFGFNANPKHMKKDILIANQQFAMFFEPNFHVPNSNFSSFINNLTFTHANFTPSIKNNLVLPFYIDMINNCIAINCPTFLCKIWDFWRISQIADIIKLFALPDGESQYHVVVSFDLPTYVNKIYLRWNSSFDQNQQIQFNYHILINSTLKYNSTKIEEEFLVKQNIKNFKLKITSSLDKNIKFFLNELIIIY